MYYIGCSFGYHDSSVCICSSRGEILGVYSEERFSRVKHDAGFPAQAIRFMVNKHSITPDRIHKVYIYEDPVAKIMRQHEQFDNIRDFAKHLSTKEFINPIERIKDALNVVDNKISWISHHESHLHAAMTLAGENSNQILGLTIDGVGEYETTCLWSINTENNLYCKKVLGNYPNSLGLFYSALTCYLGFEVNDAEFKVMGLAAYGDPVYMKEMQKLIKFDKEKGLVINSKYFSFRPTDSVPYTVELIRLLGLPAKSSEDYAEDFSTIEDLVQNQKAKRFADIAASIQEHITKIILEIVNDSQKTVPELKTICYGGGVALNTKTNQSIMSKMKGCRLYIPPDPGDGGSSLGAVAAGLKKEINIDVVFDTPYLGYDICDDTLADESYYDLSIIRLQEDELINYIAEQLSLDKVIGWVQGRAEFGPRALGNRSILANPLHIKTQRHVNRAVKFREPFRPFAPVVIDEYLEHLFEVDTDSINYTNSPARYMLSTFYASEKAHHLIPACIHVDGTSRVQLLEKKDNPLLYRLIRRFKDLTSIPALLNTSFNLRGEPIVNDTTDAIRTFRRSGLDMLVVGHNLIRRKSQKP